MRSPSTFAGGPVGALAVMLLLTATLAAGFGPRLGIRAGVPVSGPIDRPLAGASARWAWWRRHRPVPHTPPQAVDVLRVLDGDTFDARLRTAAPGGGIVRVRLRDIDAAELKARCASELRKALAARSALIRLLQEGAVRIFDVGQDKYPERIDARVATRRTPDVSAALLRTGIVRAYDGGRRRSWCG